MELNSLCSIAPSTQAEARAQEAGEQRRFEAGLFDTAPVYSDTANGSGTGTGSGIEQENVKTISFGKDRFVRLKQDYAKAKEAQRERLIFDGFDLHLEYVRRMIDQIDYEFEKADQPSPSFSFDGVGISPQIVEPCEMVNEKSESTNEELMRPSDTISEQMPESTEEPLGLAYLDFEQLMLHGKYSEAMLPNVRQRMNAALEQIEQTQAETRLHWGKQQDCRYEVPE